MNKINMAKEIICKHCNQKKIHRARQLCQQCYDKLPFNLERRRKHMAKNRKYFTKKYIKIIICKNCKQKKPHKAHGLCDNCYHKTPSQKKQRVKRLTQRIKEDPTFKLNERIKLQIKKKLKSKKNKPTKLIIGITMAELKKHLENQFDENMSWDNYGAYWHIDHKIPKSWFSKKDVLDSWHYSNLQPLEAKANLRKRDLYAD